MFDLSRDLKIYKSEEYDLFKNELKDIETFVHTKNGFSDNYYVLPLTRFNISKKEKIKKVIKNSDSLTKFPFDLYLTGIPYIGFGVKNRIKESINFLNSIGVFGGTLTLNESLSSLLKLTVYNHIKNASIVRILIHTKDDKLCYFLNASYTSDNFFGTSRDFYNKIDCGKTNKENNSIYEDIYFKGFFLDESDTLILKQIKIPKKILKDIKSISLLIPGKIIENAKKEHHPKNVIYNYFFSKNSIISSLLDGRNDFVSTSLVFHTAQRIIVKYLMLGELRVDHGFDLESYSSVDYGIRSVEDAKKMLQIINEILIIFSVMKYPNYDYDYKAIHNYAKFKVKDFLNGDQFKNLIKLSKLQKSNNEEHASIYFTDFKKAIKERICVIDDIFQKNGYTKKTGEGSFDDLFNAVVKYLKII